jgi:transposase
MIGYELWGAIDTLKKRGWSNKAIARDLRIHVQTVRKYVRRGGWQSYRRDQKPGRLLDPYGDYLRERAEAVGFNGQVLFQEIREQGYTGCYENVKRFVRPLRAEHQRLVEATVRYETAPGRQAQVDWGTTAVEIAGRRVRIRLFVMVLGYSRRIYVRICEDEKLSSLLRGHEAAFDWFGGRTEQILYDNPRTIVLKRDWEGKHIEFHPQFLDFARYYGFRPRLCRPYRARTKGKVENGIKYVKGNALVGRCFTSLEALQTYLDRWMIEVADERIHGTTHERPRERFKKEPLVSTSGRPPYRLEEEPLRVVANDLLVTFATNRYSVPLRYVGKTVTVLAGSGRLEIFCQGHRIASHPQAMGKNQVIRDPAHYRPLWGALRRQSPREQATLSTPDPGYFLPEVEVRDLATYEAFLEGGVP